MFPALKPAGGSGHDASRHQGTENMGSKAFEHRQEFVHGLIHGTGILFGVSCLPVLTALATAHQNIRGIIGAGIYGFCFLLLFTCSTLYHVVSERHAKRILEILDHISIYFLIAGTYTPFLLVYFYNPFGVSMLVLLWALAFIGIFFKAYFAGKFDKVSLAIYLLMGWTVLAGGKAFFITLPAAVLVLVAVGGILYTLGVIFYVWDKPMYNHALWHAIVLAAAVCHYVAVLLSM
jgi:hemolysin III